MRAHYLGLAVLTGDYELAAALTTRGLAADVAQSSSVVTFAGAVGSELVLASAEGTLRALVGLDSSIWAHLLRQRSGEFRAPRTGERRTEIRVGFVTAHGSVGWALRVEAPNV